MFSKHALIACALWSCAYAMGKGDILSLNLCGDFWLLELAPQRIAALTPLAADLHDSPYAALAQTYPHTRLSSEAIARSNATELWLADYQKVHPLIEQKKTIVRLHEGSTLDDLYETYRRLSLQLGLEPSAELQRMKQLVEQQSVSPDAAAIPVLLLDSNGDLLGSEHPLNEYLHLLRLRNLAAEAGIRQRAPFDPEAFLRQTPRIVFSLSYHPEHYSRSTTLHPILDRSDLVHVRLPASFAWCQHPQRLKLLIAMREGRDRYLQKSSQKN